MLKAKEIVRSGSLSLSPDRTSKVSCSLSLILWQVDILTLSSVDEKAPRVVCFQCHCHRANRSVVLQEPHFRLPG